MSPIHGLTGFGGGVVSRLLSGGGSSGGFVSLSLQVVTPVPVNNSIRGFTLSLGHSDSTDSASFTYSDTPIVVYKDSSTTNFTPASSSGEMNVPFGTGDDGGIQFNEWEWNGTNDIIVETCTSQNAGGFAQKGTLKANGSGTSGFQNHNKYSRTDSAGSSCGVTPNTGSSWSFSTRLYFANGSFYQPNWDGQFTTSSSVASPINIYYRRIIYRYIIQVSILNNSFVS